MMRRRGLRPLIWVYTICKRPFYRTLGINGLNDTIQTITSFDVSRSYNMKKYKAMCSLNTYTLIHMLKNYVNYSFDSELS